MRVRKAAFIFLLGVVVFATSGFSCIQQPLDQTLFKPVTLNYWRVFDDSDSMSDIIAAYTAIHPNVQINYRKLRYEEYENELLQGFADDRGPDIFSVHAMWVDKYRSKLAPIPSAWQVGATYVTGSETNRKEVQKQYGIVGLTSVAIRKSFVDTVAKDVIRTEEQQERVYGLPLGLDTLALFYNKEMLDNAGILEPPKDWQEFQDDVAKISVRNADDDSQLDQSGAAIGAAENIRRSFDVVSTLMAQNGVGMSDGRGPLFDQIPANAGGTSPTADSLIFYTDFAYPGKEGLYTWNEDMPDSFEAFQQSRTAMMFGYAYQAKQLREVAPRLQFGVVPMPQLDPKHPVTAANYWIEGVSKKASSIAYAWDFLQFAASEKNVKSYLANTGKPAALRSILPTQQTEEMGAFASQALFAKNWYHGKSPAEAEAAFAEMITDVLHNKGGSRAEQRSRIGQFIVRAAQKIRYGW